MGKQLKEESHDGCASCSASGESSDLRKAESGLQGLKLVLAVG